MRLWLFIGGVAVALLFALPDTNESSYTCEKADYRPGQAGLALAGMGLYCALQLPEFQQAVARTGAPTVLAWVVSLAALLVLVGLGVLAWRLAYDEEHQADWLWVFGYAAFFGAAIGYGLIAGKPTWGHSISELF
jgi:hypothetical protein